MNRYIAEFIGTLVLVLIGLGTAVFDGGSVGHLGISLAFGFALLAMIYAIGPISGCHINPAVTVGAWLAGRMKAGDVVPYFIAQILGAICGFGFIALILNGVSSIQIGATANLSGSAAVHAAAQAVANGYGAHSAIGAGLGAAFIAELLLTFVLVLTVLGATATTAPNGFAGIAIGTALAITNFVAIPITNASINPARSIAPAVYAGDWALGQLWLFIVAPVIGGIVAALVYRLMAGRTPP
jgi:aquaporin Z